MLLAIDVGNTNIVIGIYRDEELLANWRIATDSHKMPDEYAVLLINLLTQEGLSLKDVRAAIVSSVVPPLVTAFEELIKDYLGIEPLIVGPGIKTGVRILYENPKEVGSDRIVNALAAYKKYGGPGVILDFWA